DSGGNLEHHGPERERRVREEHLLDVEPGAHLEESIDAPDERHREVEEARNAVVGPDHRLRASPHAATTWVSVHALSTVAVSITAPPRTASEPGVPPSATHAPPRPSPAAT